TGQRAGADRRAAAGSALRRSRARDAGQAAAQELHTLRYQPAVGFELRLAGSAQSNAALLTLQVRPPAHQASRHMIQLRKLDLKLALGALCPLRENVQDQAGSIDDSTRERLFEIALLHTGERVIEDDELGAGLGFAFGDLGDFSASREERRIGPIAAAAHFRNDARARGR